jgi:hypothetical protein
MLETVSHAPRGDFVEMVRAVSARTLDLSKKDCGSRSWMGFLTRYVVAHSEQRVVCISYTRLGR